MHNLHANTHAAPKALCSFPPLMTRPAHSGTRLDTAHLVVLDNFITEADREELLAYLTAPQWQGPQPPTQAWERATCDGAQFPATWGLTVRAAPSGPVYA